MEGALVSDSLYSTVTQLKGMPVGKKAANGKGCTSETDTQNGFQREGLVA